MDFNPRSPRGGATCSVFDRLILQFYFNPRSPRGGATSIIRSGSVTVRLFQSTLPAGGSDPKEISEDEDAAQISIHAPRGGERQWQSAILRWYK